ncbi:hypothetical protein ACFXJ8_26020 [Nonomuraea sp. NPDC059194]|uniref:hypothetical protein n=1 Tax=Nonomuraea sp. NPDC059194 TaxID=3346764 RepID=UPI00369E645A
MADAELDFSELLPIGDEIEDRARKVAEGAYPLVKEYALKLQKRWRENARDTAPPHGKHYPRSITAEQIFNASAAEWEVGPDSALPQGGMGRGFEYGSRNQPPHLDGAQATVAVEPEFNAAVDKLVEKLL